MNNNLTTFYLVRHGQTDWNKNKILQGQTDMPLNQKGEEQAKTLAEFLKNVNFDLAFSSDLLRAKRTAEIVVLEKKLHIETTKALRERDFGHLEGGPVEALLAHIALLKNLSAQARKNHRLTEDVESDEEVIIRLITFLRETAVTHPGKTILVASHGGILRMLLIHTGYFTYEDLDKITLVNGAYVTFQSDGVDFFINTVTGVIPRDKLPESL